MIPADVTHRFTGMMRGDDGQDEPFSIDLTVEQAAELEALGAKFSDEVATIIREHRTRS